MKISGIQFPAPLLSALRNGNLVIFAGAGVSMGEPALLPKFDALARSIAQGTGETKGGETEDVFLGRLQNRGVQVHDVAARILGRNCRDELPEPTSLHRDLLRLYPEPETARIVTTNFDHLFEKAAQEVFSGQPEVFRAPHCLWDGPSAASFMSTDASIDPMTWCSPMRISAAPT